MNFFENTIKQSKYYHSGDRYSGIDLLEPGMRKAVCDLQQEARKQGIDLRILETYRSQTRQTKLFAQKTTRLRVIGCHGYGLACDFGVFTNGKYETDNKPYLFLRRLARNHGLISGQDWGHSHMSGFVDSGHVQRIPVWRQNMLFSGLWYPDADNYCPYADSTAHAHLDVTRNV